MSRSLLLGLLACLISGAAAASSPPSSDMTFQLVRAGSPACEPDCPEWIAARGEIKPETARAFDIFLSGLGGTRRSLLIESPGGSVEAALAMGRRIRALGLSVAVAHTETRVAAYPNEPAPGLVVPERGYCFSSCVFILAAGVERYVNPAERVGVHQIKATIPHVLLRRQFLVHYQTIAGLRFETSRDLIGEQKSVMTTTVVSPDAENARVAAYFTEMGEDPRLVDLMQTATPDQIHMMTPAEELNSRLVTAWLKRPDAKRDGPTPKRVEAHPRRATAGS